MRSFLAPFVAVILLTSVATHAQVAPAPPPMPPQGAMPRDAVAPQKTGTSRLAGRVVSAATGQPLRRALVRAMSPELREGRSVSTDADGRWEIKDLPAGRYNVSISKGGYVTLSYGQKRPFEQGKQVELAEGQTSDKLDVSLPKGSVITGRVLDEFGEPVAGARVAAMRHRYMQGARRLMPAGPMDSTDDLGQYRLHGLSPGDYYVSASSFGGMMMMDVSGDRTGYAETYYPGTSSLQEAQRVSVAASQEASEITFALTPTRVASISGTVTTSTGRPVANEMIVLSPANPAAMFGPMSGMGRTRPDGTFTISNVTAGDYRLEARAVGESDAPSLTGPVVAESATMPITVAGRDITGVSIVTAPTATASGRVVFEGGAPPAFQPGALNIIGTPEVPMMGMLPGGSARVREDWTFEIKGLSGRRLVRIFGAPGSWSLKSVTLDGHDVTDSAIEFKPGDSLTGLEITLTQQMPGITGTVQGERDAPAGDYVVIAYSSDSRKWAFQSRYVRSARPDLSGKFLLRALPPDEYLVVAVDYLEPGEEGDPEVLERLRRAATMVTLNEGESKTISLKLARQP